MIDTLPIGISLAALTVSVTTALLLPAWRGRRASIEIRTESFYRSGTPSLHHRLVVINHGPAAATDLHISLVDSDGNPTGWLGDREGGKAAVSLLHAGQVFHFAAWPTAATEDPDMALVSWRDRRFRTQSRRIALGLQML